MFGREGLAWSERFRVKRTVRVAPGTTLDAATRGGQTVMGDWYPYPYWQSAMYVLIPDRDFENVENGRLTTEQMRDLNLRIAEKGERDVLLLCVALELDTRIAPLCARAQDARIYGACQHQRYFAHAEARWDELARRARLPAPGMMMLLADWVRPTVSAAAVMAAAAGAFLLTGSDAAAEGTSLASQLGYSATVASWVDAESAPSVEEMVVDYQMAYQGGNGLMRLYEFDLTHKQIKVLSFSPWVPQKPADTLNSFDQAVLTTPNESFVIEMVGAEELARDPENAHLIPHVEKMREAYLSSYGRPIPPRPKE
mgnify:CR=1 FL=1